MRICFREKKEIRCGCYKDISTLEDINIIIIHIIFVDNYINNNSTLLSGV